MINIYLTMDSIRYFSKRFLEQEKSGRGGGACWAYSPLSNTLYEAVSRLQRFCVGGDKFGVMGSDNVL